MRLAVVGSQRFVYEHAEAYVRGLVRATIERHRPDVVISGGARGTDTWAAEAAVKLGYTEDAGTLLIFRPTTRRWHDGFRPRNVRVAEACTHLLAVRCREAGTYGSGWTADYAESIGRDVVRRLLPP